MLQVHLSARAVQLDDEHFDDAADDDEFCDVSCRKMIDLIVARRFKFNVGAVVHSLVYIGAVAVAHPAAAVAAAAARKHTYDTNTHTLRVHRLAPGLMNSLACSMQVKKACFAR